MKKAKIVGAMLAAAVLAGSAMPAFAAPDSDEPEPSSGENQYTTEVSYEFRETYTVNIPTSYELKQDENRNLTGLVDVSAEVMLETGKQLVVTERGDTPDGKIADGVITLRNGDNAISGTVLCGENPFAVFQSAEGRQTQQFAVLIKPDGIFAGKYNGKISFDIALK